ncbi:HK97-gp10 family putative phage morphogenesis protein [Streptomyces sp. NPDC047968]|uniref:HK97-gp10 family putative phage morphogenesis protein n=1 Tax=unclassified Streptomyces TaxID=2593676 RepID=UPI003411FAA6
MPARRRRRGSGTRRSTLDIDIVGVDRLRGQIESLEVKLRAALFKALQESAEAVVTATKPAVRKDSGNLQESVRARYENSRLRAEIGWWDRDDHYAIYHELGTRRLPAQPALGPAAEAERRKIADRIQREVRKVTR